MRRAVFAFIVGCSSLCMVNTLGMSFNQIESSGYASNNRYRKLEKQYNDLMKYQEQSEIRYIQINDKLETAQEELKKLKKDKKKLDEHYEKIQRELADISKEKDELEKESEKLRNENKILKENLSSTSKDFYEIQSILYETLKERDQITEEKLKLEDNCKKLKEELAEILAEKITVEDEVIEREFFSRFRENDRQDHDAEESLIGKNEDYSMTENDLSYLSKYELQVENINPRNEETSERSVENNNEKTNLKSEIDKAERKNLLNRDKNTNISRQDPDSSSRTPHKTLNIESKEEKISDSDTPNSPPSAKEYPGKKYFAENSSNSPVKSDLSFGNIKYSFDDSDEKLKKALREIQELKNALQKVLESKAESENNSLRLKAANSSLIRQLVEKNLEIKKFRSNLAEICRDMAEILTQINSNRDYAVSLQSKNLKKLSLIKNKLVKINSIVHKGNTSSDKLGRNKTFSPKKQRKKIRNNR